jgi:hypothetical protein
VKSLLRWTLVAMLVLALEAVGLTSTASASHLPVKFFITHIEGSPNIETTDELKVSLEGQDLTRAADGSTLTTSGSGSFAPAARQADGGGRFTIRDPAGAVKSQGAWQVTGFVSWQQLPGGFPPQLKVTAPPPPAGTAPSSGIAKFSVRLEGVGDATMEVHCTLPTTPDPNHTLLEGVILTGAGLNFTTPVVDETAPTAETTIFLAPVAAPPAAPAPAAPAPALAPAPAAAPAPAPVAQPARAPAQLPRTGLAGAGFVPLGLALGGLLMGAGFWSRRR